MQLLKSILEDVRKTTVVFILTPLLILLVGFVPSVRDFLILIFLTDIPLFISFVIWSATILIFLLIIGRQNNQSKELVKKTAGLESQLTEVKLTIVEKDIQVAALQSQKEIRDTQQKNRDACIPAAVGQPYFES